MSQIIQTEHVIHQPFINDRFEVKKQDIWHIYFDL